jgi:signal transduction histidine kinase/DNA-binding response OmpR family regulator/CHASE3 domain sensor protein
MTDSNNSYVIRQLKTVFSISVALLLVSLYASYTSITRLIDNSKMVNHTNMVLIQAENLISYMKDAETGHRGFLASGGDVSFLEPYNYSRQKVLKTYADLTMLTGNNPKQQAYLKEALRLINKKYQQMETMILLTKSGQYGLAYEKEKHKGMTQGKLVMDTLRAVVVNMKTEEKKLLEIRTAEQTKYILYTPSLVLVAALISILITVLSYVRIKRDVDKRIAQQKADEAKYIETSERISIMEAIAKKIADGNYTVRSNDQRQDELGRISKALNEMTGALEQNFNHLKDTAWLQTGSVKLSDAMRGEKNLHKLSTNLINVIIEYLEAPLGTLYLVGKHSQLLLVGSFAAEDAPKNLKIGEGLVGQVVKSKKLMVLNDLPSNYLSIKSSIGHTLPTSLVILPLMYSNEVIAVVEIGLLRTLTTIELEFLEKNSEAIGIGLNAALDYEKLQHLLEETQAQSEELQTQHGELENLNTELEAQAQKLQASEEELRVQQEELQQTNEELEERSSLLEEKNVDIQRKAEELAIATRYKSEFLANMSHELRTPLNSILLLSRLLSENNDKNLNNDQVEYAKVIQSSGNGLLALIDEILDLSKIEAGKMSLEFQQVSISEIIDDLQSLFNPIANEKKIDFHVIINKDVPKVIETDRMRVDQILKNLISNALKFTDKGSVTMEVKNVPGNDKVLCFEIKDTGIGIAKDKQQLIFEAFQQADGSTKRKYGGTGLGLSISKELTKLLNGELKLTSEPDKGSTFSLFIPILKIKAGYVSVIGNFLKEQQQETSIPPLPIEKAQNDDMYVSNFIPQSIPDDRDSISKNDKIILIIEDDTVLAKALLEYTRRKKYKGIVSVRGDEGLSLALKYKPMGILLDIHLPVKSGWEVMEELKANMETKHIPIHIMSSNKVKNESITKGAVDFIDKPIAFEQMSDVFKKIEYIVNNKSKKVLIVEENPKHAKALAYFLETCNISSDVKSDFKEGIEALKNESVDCVILDMEISNIKSYNLLEEAKKNSGLDSLPIIIFTGRNLSTAEEQKIKQYADSIIVKTAHSYQRMLDEVSLFLHLVGGENEAKKGDFKKLGALNQILNEKTVLVVDDDVRNIFSLSKALEKLKINVITAIDGNEAMKKLNENPGVDAVLLDMMMPQMDGYQTATKIREQARWKNLPVIAVTAKAMSGDREKCIDAGASDYITKPIDIDQLLSLLRVWLYYKN